MYRTTFRKKLYLAFGALSLSVVAAAGFALHALVASDDHFDRYVEGINERQVAAAQLQNRVLQRATEARDAVNAAGQPAAQALVAATAETHRQVQASLALLKTLSTDTATTAEERQALDQIIAVEKRYAPVALAVVELARSGDRDGAVAKIQRDCRPLLAELRAATDNYLQHLDRRSKQEHAATHDTFEVQRATLLSIAAFSVLAAMLTGFFITRDLWRSLGDEPASLGAAARRVADGDLSADGRDATEVPGSVSASLSQMRRSLADLVGQVRSSGDSIATAATQIAVGNGDLSQRTEEQASQLQQTSASMTQLAGAVKNSTEAAQSASRMAAGSAASARQGGEVVAQVVSTMQGIAEASREVAAISSVIEGIAFQTNILALNAAVEAARAGEQGRGFAVVAGEVRALAHRSGDAAKQIKALIDASAARVDSGARLATEAGTAMADIVAGIEQVNQAMQELAQASTQQSVEIHQVGDAISQLDTVTQQNAALVEQTAAAAESLRQQASQMTGTIAKFRLSAASPAPAVTTPAPQRPLPRPAQRANHSPLPAATTTAHAAHAAPVASAPAQAGGGAGPSPAHKANATTAEAEWASF